MSANEIAAIVAHPDDEVLGCGGTLARFASQGRKSHVLIMGDGESARWNEPNPRPVKQLIEERRASAREACKVLGCTSVNFLDLPDNRFDTVELLKVVKHIEAFIAHHQPSTVFTHHGGDVNIDHRVVHEGVLAACRPLPGEPVKELLFFEVPSSSEWRTRGSTELFAPNYFVNIATTFSTKMAALNIYRNEMRDFPHPRSTEAVKALVQWRGATAGVEAAEAFILGRKIIDVD